ncbi:hypothetical protein ESCO_001690 [Escovopsis weberi]|uniref:Biogenesis of lysosome-related organelles complex 1 subunit 1 n=1 Tax=Escovopsis weberi TaxID=150374 RepID=A0A0M9VW58_ESCWE|nr:hypothetical protein ESCO_001690 [Escovopsis weberi]
MTSSATNVQRGLVHGPPAHGDSDAHDDDDDDDDDLVHVHTLQGVVLTLPDLSVVGVGHHPSLPSASTERHITQARAAVVASIGNMLDAELQSRAQMLHDNAAVLDAQERDVARAAGLLGRESARLAKEADGAARKLKEVGNVQNWAEVLERGFLVLEETTRPGGGEE